METQLQKTQNIKQGMMQELLTDKTRLVQPVCKSIKEEHKSIAIVAESKQFKKRNKII